MCVVSCGELRGGGCCIADHADHVVLQMFEAWLRPQVVLLDVGMATELSNADRDNMLHLFRAFSELDGERMAESTLNFAGGEQRCVDREGFKLAIAE